MNIEASMDSGYHVFKITGEVDLKSSPALREKLQAAMKEKPKGLLFEMSGCPYIDSSGIATLVEAIQKLRTYGGKMALASPTQRVKDIFHIVHLDGIIPLFATYGEARDSLK